MTGTDWSVSAAPGETGWARVEEATSPVGARRLVTGLAERLGFGGERLGQIQLAVTEAATNLVKHARQGELAAQIVRDGDRAALEVVCVDRGPGIPDVSRSRRDGFSTSGTLGLGLGMIERLADVSGLHSHPDRGTALFLRFHAPAAGGPAGPPVFAGLTRPIEGEQECGDAYAARVHDGTVYLMLCDGLGHGPLAARASREAVRAVSETEPARPVDLLKAVHRRLAGTRGGAVAVAAVDPAAGRVRFAGLGNVAGWIVGPDRRQGMISVPGIAGAQARSFREHEYALPPGAAVVLHSDGLTDRWSPDDRPGLYGRDPLLVAAALLHDAGVRRDDRSVLAAVAPR